ncbi:PAS domain S-box-containing protein [Chryseolinea serpens]|uniref:histidine kinase n=1 Tax=Chryseolinea serpens TaxID=947013 RepID=A0A1M5JXB1_9BACT|nr:PAS domain S-box protein [Chryseolinea serpens]SHG45222.1 PAS domain S-box-containing protein [Chryseolinea serpens]
MSKKKGARKKGGQGSALPGKALKKKKTAPSLKNTDKALRKSQQQLSLALKAAKMGLWEWDLRKEKIHWSQDVHRIFSVSQKAFDGSFEGYLKLIHPDDKAFLLATIKETLSERKNYYVRHRIVHKDGTVRWVEAQGDVVLNKKGKPVKLTGTVQDITDKKTDELEKEDWKTRYELVAASTGQVIYDYDTATGRIAWSNNMRAVFGYTGKELKDIKKWESLIHPHDREHASRELDRAEASLKPFDIQYRFKVKSGEYRFVHDRGFFITLPTGKVHRMLGAMEDITDDVKTEESLVQSNRFKESLESALPGMLYVYDLQAQKNVYLNRNVFSLLGYTPEEIQRMGSSFVSRLMHPDDLSAAPVWTNEPFGVVKEIEYRLLSKKGEWKWFMGRDTPFQHDKNGRVTQIIGIAQDITAKKENENLIHESEKSYRELFNLLGQEIYVLTAEGTFIDVNEGACRESGYEKDELIGQTPAFLGVDDKNNSAFADEVLRLANVGIPQVTDWSGKKKNGEAFLKEVRIVKGSYFGKEVLIAAAWDITERKRTEDALRYSEHRFRNLIRNLNVGVLLRGPEAEVLIGNKSALQLLGISEDQLIGKTSFDPEWNVILEDGTDFPNAEHPIHAVIRNHKPVLGVVMGVYHPKKKSRVWLYVNAEPILNVDGELKEVVCTFTDITERKKIEEELIESEQRFRTMQQASFGGIGLHNKGMIIDCNQGLCDITGYTREELVGMNGLLLVAAEYRQEVMEKIVSGFEKSYDVEGVHKDGTRYALEIQAKNIPYHGEMIRVTEFRDITDRKLAAEKILEQNARLVNITEDMKRKNEQLEEFTQIVSHNLRSPVGNILTLLSFFESSAKEEEREEYLGLLKESGATTLRTLHELNEVLKIKQNKSLERQKVSFEDVLQNSKSMLSAKIAEVGALIHSDFAGAPMISYPNIYLESIFLNLLSNSLKYIRPNLKPEVWLKTYYKDGNIVLEVSDNGLGINLERYGHQVFKLHKTFHRHPESRGIGLFMIKNQIEAMGGEIAVQSQVNQGTTFIVNFDKYNFNDN